MMLGKIEYAISHARDSCTSRGRENRCFGFIGGVKCSNSIRDTIKKKVELRETRRSQNSTEEKETGEQRTMYNDSFLFLRFSSFL